MDFVYEQLIVVSSTFFAVMETRFPSDTPGSPTAGVLSLVMLSVDEIPRSEVARRSGTFVAADGAVVSIVRFSAGLGAETFPSASVIVDVTLHEPSPRLERSHDCVPVPLT
jgi:hypothetical protein